MAYASITYTSASGTTFALTNSEGIAIGYIRQQDVKVYVNSVLKTLGVDYNFNSVGTAIVFNTALSNATVLIQRITEIAEPTVIYTAGSTLTASDLNNADNQIRFGLQEFRDSVNSGQGVTDGDKGDIIVGNNGSTWSIDASSVVEGKIASSAVTESKIISSAVTESKIASNAVTESKIASNAVTESKISNNAVTETKLADNSVTSAKIVAETIVNSDISSTAAINGTKISPNFGSQNIQTTGSVQATGNIQTSGNIVLVGSTSGNTSLVAPATAGSNTLILPSNNGAANQFVKNTGTAGTLGWSNLTEDSNNRLFGKDGGLISASQYYRLESAVNHSNSNTAQNIFGVGPVLSSSTIYEFESVFTLRRASSAYATHTISIGFGGGTGTLVTTNNILYYVIGTFSASASAVEAPDVNSVIETTNSSVITAASGTTTGNLVLKLMIKGTVSVNAGGTFIPQFTLSAAPGVTTTYQTLAGSSFRIWAIGSSGSNTSIGTWQS